MRASWRCVRTDLERIQVCYGYGDHTKMNTEFDRWWDSDYDDTTNPYCRGTPAYWAWAGWQAATKQRTENALETKAENARELGLDYEPEPEDEEIELDLTDAELLAAFKAAHRANLTFNQYVNVALAEYLERYQNDPLHNKLDGSSDNVLVQGTWPYPS